jgi:hypothetical protein
LAFRAFFYYEAKGTNLELKTQPKTTFRLSPVRYRAPLDDHLSYTVERTVKTFFLHFQNSREGDKETKRQGDKETRRQGDKETRRQGDKETRRQGDKETRRQGEKETRREGEREESKLAEA